MKCSLSAKQDQIPTKRGILMKAALTTIAVTYKQGDIKGKKYAI
jgi:hypothetical protein